eukprot:456552-Pelagomonas_calceolata.AAC.1
MPVQLEAALEAGNVDTACFCLRSWIMQAANKYHVGMCKVQDYIFQRFQKRGIRRPLWFIEQCCLKRRLFIQAVKSGQAVHACQKTKKQGVNNVPMLHRHTPDIHELMRKAEKSHPTPITAEGWSSYLQGHFRTHINSSSHTNVAAVHMHGHPSCPAGSNTHISPQQLGPMGSRPESTSSTMQRILASLSRGMEYFYRTVHGVTQRVTARWTGRAVPLGRLT